MFAEFEHLVYCFCAKSPTDKLRSMAALDVNNSELLQGLSVFAGDSKKVPAQSTVGYPRLPQLVDARKLPKRALTSPEGRGAFFHAICHIEFTAINLALDAVLRFANMPAAYYRDWLVVAKEEAVHFQLLQAHLNELGFNYGDFDAHNGMWQLAERTSHDILLRMALVPRVLEARGLDVSPQMIKRLEQANDSRGATLLARIYEDEIEHVATGTRWFNFVAKARGEDPETVFFELIKNEFGKLRTNRLNTQARVRAGFTETELAGLLRFDDL